MSKPYKRFPGDIEMEKGFNYGLHFVEEIKRAGGNFERIDLSEMSAMDLLNLLNTNNIYLEFRGGRND